MSNLIYTPHRRLILKTHPELTEKWVQERIAEDPSVLGLGDLILKDAERDQPRAGRLDLLLQDSESNSRYEVEIQLGSTDESHIIRTIEYWDIERKRYPQYDHTAVIVAEDITSRFLNVISLFNGFIPLVAIQMNAIQVGDHLSLVFLTVLDQMQLGLVEEDEELQAVTDRSYWEQRGTPRTTGMTDKLLEIIQEFDPELELKYNKFYIGLAKNDHPNNFAIFRPQKSALRLEIGLPRADETTHKLDQAGLDVMDYDRRWSKYRIRLTQGDIQKHKEVLSELLRQAYDQATN